MSAKATRSAAWICMLLAAGTASARPAVERNEVAPTETDVDVVGDVDGTQPAPRKVLADTVWVADWSFDTGGPCDATGWIHVDNHILNDGSNYWHMEPGFNGIRTITGQAAALGYHNNTCCVDLNGYDNDWYYGIRMTYRGAATLSFDYLVDSETGFDFLQVETDSACASFTRVDFFAAPSRPSAANYRTAVFGTSGYNGPPGNAGNSHVANQALTNYGPGTHCAYISFFADGGYSPCDGSTPTNMGEAAVIDNIALTDADGTRSENFEDGLLSNGWSFMNMWDTKPFGKWARLYSHITDNDQCTENTTCAWLWSDNTTPTIANDPSMAFGPGGYVVRNWLDDAIIGPWVSLTSTPAATGTILRFRRFGGNFFATSRIEHRWSVRAKLACGGISAWGHAFSGNHLDSFQWIDAAEFATPGGFNMTPYFNPTAAAIQLRFRTVDFQFIAGSSPPSPFIPGPGPFVDRARIGRVILSGPVISEGTDARSQGQDCFPTEINPAVTPAGEHYRPTTDRFGTCAFSEGTDLAINRTGPNLVTGDSVNVSVVDARGGGGVTSVQWYGAIVRGPHQGLAPAPWAVGASGFFAVNADSSRTAAGVAIANRYFVDLDDTYFRGGDELHYFWLAQDAQGGVTSDPEGITALAQITSDAAVQARTGGMLEVSFLPQINWNAAYLARIRSQDPGHGDVAPTAGEIAASTQRSCILYVNHINSRRRSGDVNRTSFMYTLDNLGYRGFYDVYDHQGMGNTNNHLGGRATIQQALGYNLIVYDAGNSSPGRPIMPNGLDLDLEKIDQATWFRNWLAQAALPGVDFGTLWVIGSNAAEEHPTNALYTADMGVSLAATNQGLSVSPDCAGQATFSFDRGAGSTAVDFTTGNRATFGLNGGCAILRDYDALNTSAATSSRVYRYRDPRNQALGAGAVVMNVNAGEDFNTILMSFPWFDIRDATDKSPPPPYGQPLVPPTGVDLLSAILNGTLPVPCLRTPSTDVPRFPPVDAPAVTVLRQNHPNPFNPVTTIQFDLAASGRVQLRIYDAAGRKVRTLVDAEMRSGWNRSVAWNGLDDGGRRVPTGVYLYRLDATGISMTKKMVLMK